MRYDDVVEMSISEMCAALESGRFSSVELVCAYLNRIAYYDRTGLCLNSVPVLNTRVLQEAAASDARRRRGEAGPLEGVPFTVKDSYMVKGLTVASGSPALKDLIATGDAASVEQLRQAGAVLLGKTNMPPMAAGGVQPGVYGYARSPYTPQYLTAAYGSGSSNGAATSTAASFAAFGMAEETVSSGRSPASNNSLVTYTPSRGVLSIRGNWPLRPTCDVVAPHTRTVEDLLRLLEVLVAKDPATAGDFWRQQNVVPLPSPAEVFPQKINRQRSARLDGVRLGVPKMYIGKDPELLDPPLIRPTVRTLWEQAATDLRGLGADVIEVDLPVVSNYEESRPGALGLAARGLVPENWRDVEGGVLTAMALDQFLRQNSAGAADAGGDGSGEAEANAGGAGAAEAGAAPRTWAEVDGDTVFPAEDAPVHVWITRARGGFDWQRLAELAKAGLPESYDDVPELAQLLTGLEAARTIDFEEWLAAEELDGIVFPAAGDVGRDDLFTRPESLDHASRNGVAYSNGNRVIRHLGIPTVTVPMGFMADIQMPVGLTFAGQAYADDTLLSHAWAYEQASRRRQRAFLTPPLPSGRVPVAEQGASSSAPEGIPSVRHAVSLERHERSWEVTADVETSGTIGPVQVWADGHILLPVKGSPGRFRGRISTSRARLAEELMILSAAGGTASLSFEPLPAAP